jgi:hypothetical protein
MSSSIGIGYGNLIDTGTLSGSGWNSGQPLNNLKVRDLAVFAQSDATTAEIIIDHGSAVTAQVFGLVAHQIEEAGATIRVTRGTTSGGAEVWDSGVQPCWPFTPFARDGEHFGLWIVAPSPTVARYTRIYVAGGPAVIRIGRAFVGPMFRPRYSPSLATDGWREPNSVLDRLVNGRDLAWRRREQRSVPLQWGAFTEAEGSLWHEIVRTHGITGEVALVRSVNDRAIQQQHGFLGTMRGLSALERPAWMLGAAGVVIDERGGAPVY